MRRYVVIVIAVAVVAAAAPARGAKGDITLLGQRSLPNHGVITDVWGYVDPNTGHEYAICGDWTNGVYIVDVTDPGPMTIVDHVPGISGFDVKVWDHYVYACDGDGVGVDGRIIDIASPASAVLKAATFDSAHNIAISGNGLMILESPGMRLYSLADPLNPAFLSRSGKFGHDATPVGNIVYDFTGSPTVVNVWNVSNPSSPALLGTVSGGIAYAHSGDVTAGGDYLYVCDELAIDPLADITVWNISSLGAPVKVAEIADPTATVHNLYIDDGLAFVSHYTAGFKVFDVSDPASPVLADTYDTSGYSGDGFDGAFGVYPYAPSGNVYVTDHPNGLYVFGVEREAPTAADVPTGGARLSSHPNPFNPATTIAYVLDRPGEVTLTVYDARGRRIRTLVDGRRAAGQHEVIWDGTGDGGAPAASGVYFARLSAGDAAVTTRMTLVK